MDSTLIKGVDRAPTAQVRVFYCHRSLACPSTCSLWSLGSFPNAAECGVGANEHNVVCQGSLLTRRAVACVVSVIALGEAVYREGGTVVILSRRTVRNLDCKTSASSFLNCLVQPGPATCF